MNTKINSKMEEKKHPMPPLRATIRFQSYPNEIWKEFKPEGARRRYMASNLGRIASFYEDLNKDGYILKVSNGQLVSGAKIGLKVYKKGTKLGVKGQPISEITNISYPVHKIIADLFLEKPEDDEITKSFIWTTTNLIMKSAICVGQQKKRLGNIRNLLHTTNHLKKDANLHLIE